MSTARIPNLKPDSSNQQDFEIYYPSVDSPKISYRSWLEHRDNDAIFKFGTKIPEVAIVGAGAGGLVAAYELAKAGAKVTVYEATDRIGGRLYANKFYSNVSSPNLDIAEMGAMRFPPSEETFFHYLSNTFGIDTEATFPDPGKVPTLVSYKGITKSFDNDDRFKKVSAGYEALLSNDLITKDTKTVLASPQKISNALNNASNGAPEVVEMFQGWLDEFGNRSYYAGLCDIFSGKGRWSVPNEEAWVDEDFTKFAVLGIGSGGFGPQYPVNFNIEIRLSMNAQEAGQRFVPGGTSQLTDSFANSIGRDNIHTSSPVTSIDPFRTGSDQLKVNVSYDTQNGPQTRAFDRVIVATTTRSMEFNTNIANVNKKGKGEAPAAIANNAVTEAIRRVHMQQASKIFVRTKKFWENDASLPRVILSDTKIAQMYTLDYSSKSGDENTGVVLLTYVWGDDAAKWSSYVGDNRTRVELLKNDLNDLLAQSEYSNYSNYINPLDNDYENNVKVVDWISENFYHGAYTLSHPGGDEYIARMYYDFQKGIRMLLKMSILEYTSPEMELDFKGDGRKAPCTLG